MKKLFISEYLNYVFQKKVWIVENIYMIKIMQLYYSSYNKKFISHTFFTDAINNSSFPIFLNQVNKLNDKILYHSQVHGVKHILNVTFFSFLIACNENMSANDMGILLETALYHDIGRNDDMEDSDHGHRGAKKILMHISDNKMDMIIPAVIHAHSLLDEEAYQIFRQYNIEKSQYARYSKILSIIKDADALDRFRLRPNSLKPEYFRIDFSKILISLACVLSKVEWHE